MNIATTSGMAPKSINFNACQLRLKQCHQVFGATPAKGLDASITGRPDEMNQSHKVINSALNLFCCLPLISRIALSLYIPVRNIPAYSWYSVAAPLPVFLPYEGHPGPLGFSQLPSCSEGYVLKQEVFSTMVVDEMHRECCVKGYNNIHFSILCMQKCAF